MATQAQTPGTPVIPDPDTIQTPGISDALKRKLFFGFVGLIVLILLANLFSPNTPPVNPAAQREQKRPAQSPTVQEVTDLKKSIDESAALLQANLDRDQQAGTSRASQRQTLADIQAADAERDAQQQRAIYDATHGQTGSPGSLGEQRQAAIQQREQQAYKALFADNRVTQTGPAASFSRSGSPASAVVSAVAPQVPTVLPVTPASSPETVNERPADKKRRALDFDPAAQPLYWLPEGSIIEAELTNRLDGDETGPVNVMVTNDVYKPGTRLVLIPQGARGLGEAREVSLLGQQRLAVTFHRILTPGLNGYGIPLDKAEPGLAQGGEVGLHDKVNNHYASIFGASLAVGAIGGLAQIGNTGTTITPLGQFRNGVSSSTAQSADRILDRFLNRLPSITIRAGTRVKIILTDDLALPAYQPRTE